MAEQDKKKPTALQGKGELTKGVIESSNVALVPSTDKYQLKVNDNKIESVAVQPKPQIPVTKPAESGGISSRLGIDNSKSYLPKERTDKETFGTGVETKPTPSKNQSPSYTSEKPSVATNASSSGAQLKVVGDKVTAYEPKSPKPTPVAASTPAPEAAKTETPTTDIKPVTVKSRPARPPVKQPDRIVTDEDMSKKGYTLVGYKGATAGSNENTGKIWRKGPEMTALNQSAARKTDENIVKSKTFQQMAQKDKGYQAGYVGAGGNLESLREKVALQTETKKATADELKKNPDMRSSRIVQTGGEADKAYRQYEKNVKTVEAERKKERENPATMTGGYWSSSRAKAEMAAQEYESKFAGTKGMQPGQVAEINNNARTMGRVAAEERGYTKRQAAPPVQMYNTDKELQKSLQAGMSRRGESPVKKASKKSK